METTFNVDVAEMVQVLTLIVVALLGWVGKRKIAAAHDTVKDVKILVNNAMTVEKQIRLADLKAQKIVLEKVLGEDMHAEHRALLEDMKERIGHLEADIERRDYQAAVVHGKQGKGSSQ